MWKYILKRLGYMLLTLLAVVSITFLLVHSIPGDPFTSMVEDLPEETRQLYMEKYGFDQPLIVQYVRYIKQLLTGDLGASLRYPGRKVGEIVSQYAPVSASIGGLALGFGIVLGLTLGIVAALKQNRWPDRLVMVLALMGTAIPTFVIAAVLQYALTVTWPVFPTTGYGTWKHLVLPVTCMCVSPLASYARYMRSSVLDTAGQDYILTAEAKGVSRFHIVTRHILRNAILPCITMICVSVGGIFSGSFIIEKIFAIPGLGKYFISAINDRDYSVVLGLNVIFTGIYVTAMLLSDILLMLCDPRLRLSNEK